MTQVPGAPFTERDSFRHLLEECFRREAGLSVAIPEENADVVETGVLDSMGWVSFLRTVESASGAGDLSSRLSECPATFAAILKALHDSKPRSEVAGKFDGAARLSGNGVPTILTASAACAGSRRVPSEEVDRAFSMPVGKLRSRAGIESLAYAVDGESELSLSTKAAQEALRAAGCAAHQLDWIIATSETHHGYPSLAAQLHSRLLVRENCGALDVGGACLGFLNALAVAQSLISSGQAQTVVAVTADVHSRTLTPSRVAGEFGGLFGDGASAFVLRSDEGDSSAGGYRLGEFFFGCAGQYAEAIKVSDAQGSGLKVHFDGEALSRAAITRLEKVIAMVELRSGIPRSSVSGFATHQPNPRLIALLARQLGVSASFFPAIARFSGNLGSSTCGAALHECLRFGTAQLQDARRAIFLASLGPGLLFGGGWLTTQV